MKWEKMNTQKAKKQNKKEEKNRKFQEIKKITWKKVLLAVSSMGEGIFCKKKVQNAIFCNRERNCPLI